MLGTFLDEGIHTYHKPILYVKMRRKNYNCYLCSFVLYGGGGGGVLKIKGVWLGNIFVQNVFLKIFP